MTKKKTSEFPYSVPEHKPFHSEALEAAIRETKSLRDALAVYGREHTPAGRKATRLMIMINTTINGLSDIHDTIRTQMRDPENEFTAKMVKDARESIKPFVQHLQAEINGEYDGKPSKA